MIPESNPNIFAWLIHSFHVILFDQRHWQIFSLTFLVSVGVIGWLIVPKLFRNAYIVRVVNTLLCWLCYVVWCCFFTFMNTGKVISKAFYFFLSECISLWLCFNSLLFFENLFGRDSDNHKLIYSFCCCIITVNMFVV